MSGKRFEPPAARVMERVLEIPVRVLNDQGGAGTTHDLEFRLPDGGIGAVEVTSLTEAAVLRLVSARERSGATVPAPGLARRWLVWPQADVCYPRGTASPTRGSRSTGSPPTPEGAFVQLKDRVTTRAEIALRVLEAREIFAFNVYGGEEYGRRAPAEVRLLESLGLEWGFAHSAGFGVPGEVEIQLPAGVGVTGPDMVVDAAIGELARNEKLRKVVAAERHFFVWIDSFSAWLPTLGMGKEALPTTLPVLGPGITAMWVAGRPEQHETVVWRFHVSAGRWERSAITDDAVQLHRLGLMVRLAMTVSDCRNNERYVER